jgi:hypothetical protein
LSRKSRTTTRAEARSRFVAVSRAQKKYVGVVPEDLRLAGVLETVLHYASDQQDEI